MGFGRIGRTLFRIAQENARIELPVISDLGRPEILHYLLQHDTIHRVYGQEVQLEGDMLVVGQRRSRLLRAVAPGDVPWESFDLDMVVDATGKYRQRTDLQAHLDAGARRVIFTTLPVDDVDRLVVIGVNEQTIRADDRIISAGSSTTHALALMLRVLSDNFQVDRAMMTTIHAYTGDQPAQDTAGADFRRSRSAAENIIPNENWSPRWVEHLLPHLAGRLEGIALNVPVPNGSCLDLTTLFADDSVTVDQVNEALRRAAAGRPDLIEVTSDPIVSSDVIGNRHSLVFDARATMKASRRMVKTLSWYDNGWGHACRIVDLIETYSRLMGNTGT